MALVYQKSLDIKTVKDSTFFFKYCKAIYLGQQKNFPC